MPFIKKQEFLTLIDEYSQNENLTSQVAAIRDYCDGQLVLEYTKLRVFIDSFRYKKLGYHGSSDLTAMIKKIKNYLRLEFAEYKETHYHKFPKGSHIIYQCVTGSQSYGLSTPKSDVDMKGVYRQRDIDILSSDYVPFVKITKDEGYFEIRRFLELLSNGDAGALELLNSPKNCILIEYPEIRFLKRYTDTFVTKRTYFTIFNYALHQFQKATNQNRMYNWDSEDITRKDVLDFCVLTKRDTGEVVKLKDYLTANNLRQEDCSATKIKGGVGNYKLYTNSPHRGLVSPDTEQESNDLRLAPIPKDKVNDWVGSLNFNKTDYSIHCKKYNQYTDWKEKRNAERFLVNKSHGQDYDAKNLMHTVRLIMMANDIPDLKRIPVDRSKDRDYLLSIKFGAVDLKTTVETWLAKKDEIEAKYKNSDLPEKVNPETLIYIEKYMRLRKFIYKP